jgi:cytochrome P450
MREIVFINIIGFAALCLLLSCGPKAEVKQEAGHPLNQQTNQAAFTGNPDDISFEHVMSVLKSSLDDEKANNNSTTKLNVAKAYILLIKFIHTDRDKVVKSGMTSEDINSLVGDASDKAQSRLKDIIGDPTAPDAVRDEAKLRLQELGTL